MSRVCAPCWEYPHPLPWTEGMYVPGPVLCALRYHLTESLQQSFEVAVPIFLAEETEV